ncbi:hypothetical protein JW905_14215 [bacterium]|nr:hypothetical protein [candidate division CSSED10-310 bacterium]
MNRILFGLVPFLVLLCSACAIRQTSQPAVHPMDPLETLDDEAVFSFAIMSDNKGDGPLRIEFMRMQDWMKRAGTAFVIGMGDHLKRGWTNDFLDLLRDDPWWHERFFPGIADGENEYYGSGQEDWGAGRELMAAVTPFTGVAMEIQPNGVDYVAHIPAGAYTVHWIHGHFPDMPEDPNEAFPESTRMFMERQLAAIDKGPRDIIVVGAHSFNGFWLPQLQPERRRLFMTKADLILSATTHIFSRQELPGFEGPGALCINTGSITYPNSYCQPGFVQVYILENPSRLAVVYLDASKPEREPQIGRYSWIKYVDGPVETAPMRDMRESEDLDRVVGSLPEAMDDKQVTARLDSLIRTELGADICVIFAESGLPAGPVTVLDLWSACPYNNAVWVVTLTREQWRRVFGSDAPAELPEPFQLAIGDFWAHTIRERVGLADELVHPSVLREHDVLVRLTDGNRSLQP